MTDIDFKATNKRELLQEFRMVEHKNATNPTDGKVSFQPRIEGFRRLWDTWIGLGGNIAKPNMKYFSEGIIYLIEDLNFNNYLLYCKKETVLDDSDKDENKTILNDFKKEWSNCRVSDYDLGELTFGNSIISAEFDLLLTPDEITYIAETYHKLNEDNSFIREPIDESYVPFGELRNKGYDTGSVIINDDDYARCIECLGYPFIQEDELEYDRNTIIRMAIKPALERYFKYFPKTEIRTYPITGNIQQEPFPPDAYAVIHFSVQQGRNVPSGTSSNPLLRFFDEMQYMGGMGAGLTGQYHGLTAPKTQTETMNNFVYGRAAQQAVINYRTRAHWEVVHDKEQRYIKFYANKMGLAEVHFAVRTNNFNDVEFARKPELYKLCNAEVKKLFGNLRRQIKSDLPGVVDYGTWLTEAQTEIEEVETNWKSIVKYSSIIRGSL